MTVDDTEATWFLAQIKPNCARIAARNLDRQGFSTFLPMAQETRVQNDRFVMCRQPIFPGYIFVAFDVTKGFWHRINATHGITRLVSFGTEPAAVPAALISQLMLRCDPDGMLLPHTQLKAGDQVKLTTGPFASFVGGVDSIAPDRRVWVLMEIMGAQTRVAVDARHLQAASGKPNQPLSVNAAMASR